ncbi:MAG: hypothetical protein FWG87_09810 [Defluviitaleaceae bacterium]|nr:hypothetical protein [Defluviitaleaceae bacterium]
MKCFRQIMNADKAYNALIVGDGFIRPEVRTFVNSGQVTSINTSEETSGRINPSPTKTKST